MSGQTYLLAEEELPVLAAVGGLNGLLSLQTVRLSGRADPAETVYGLFRRGALVQKGAGLGLSEELEPVFACMRRAGSVLLLTPRELSAPQLCLYPAGDEAAYVTPHETKRDSLRLGLTAAEDLPGLLEDLGLLPVSHMAEPVAAPLREEEIPPLELPLGPDGRLEAPDERVLTVLERFDLPSGTVRERAAVFRAPLSWAAAYFTDRTEYRPYERGDLLRWIKEGSL